MHAATETKRFCRPSKTFKAFEDLPTPSNSHHFQCIPSSFQRFVIHCKPFRGLPWPSMAIQGLPKTYKTFQGRPSSADVGVAFEAGVEPAQRMLRWHEAGVESYKALLPKPYKAFQGSPRSSKSFRGLARWLARVFRGPSKAARPTDRRTARTTDRTPASPTVSSQDRPAHRPSARLPARQPARSSAFLARVRQGGRLSRCTADPAGRRASKGFHGLPRPSHRSRGFQGLPSPQKSFQGLLRPKVFRELSRLPKASEGPPGSLAYPCVVAPKLLPRSGISVSLSILGRHLG